MLEALHCHYFDNVSTYFSLLANALLEKADRQLSPKAICQRADNQRPAIREDKQ